MRIIAKLIMFFSMIFLSLSLSGCFVPVVQGLKAISASKNPPNYNNINDANSGYAQ